MKDSVIKTGFKIYKLVYGENPSDGVKVFIENLYYMAIGFGFYAVFGFAFQVIAGRFLGPVEYGKYALIQSIAIFLSLPMNLGVSTALIKYNAESENKDRQSKIISTSFYTVVIFSFMFLSIFLLFTSQISGVFGVTSSFFSLAVIYAFTGNIYMTAISIFRSLHKNKEYSFLQGFYGFLMFILILFFIFNKFLSFRSAVFASYIAYFVILILTLFSLKKYFTITFSKKWVKKIIKYGLFATIGGLSFAFLSNFNLLIINKFLSAAEVGIYNAYYFSSIAILSIFLTIFVTVFFPTISKYEKKQMIFEKVDKMLPILFLVGIPTLFILEFMILKLYGRRYPINYLLMIEFIFAGFSIFSYGFYDWTFCSEGIRGVKFSALVISIVAVVNIIISPLAISKIGLAGAVFSLGFSYLIGIICFQFLRKKIV